MVLIGINLQDKDTILISDWVSGEQRAVCSRKTLARVKVGFAKSNLLTHEKVADARENVKRYGSPLAAPGSRLYNLLKK